MAKYEMLTKSGHSFYDMASLLQNAIRRNKYELAGYAAAELFPKYKKWLWKRLLIISAEDCYGIITGEILALMEANEKMTKPNEETIFVAKAISLLCAARKNLDADYFACNLMHSDGTRLSLDEIPMEKDLEECRLDDGKIPEWVYNWHTLAGRKMGRDVVDQINTRQAALEPLQTSLFDDCSWDYDINQCLPKHNPNHYPLPYHDGKMSVDELLLE